MSIEYLLVSFTDKRAVLADGNPVGFTNHMMLLPGDEYLITLDGDGYQPPSQDIVLSGTSLVKPMVIAFTPAAGAAAARPSAVAITSTTSTPAANTPAAAAAANAAAPPVITPAAANAAVAPPVITTAAANTPAPLVPRATTPGAPPPNPGNPRPRGRGGKKKGV